MRPETRERIRTAKPGEVVQMTEAEMHEYAHTVHVLDTLPATFTEDDLWNHIVSKLGFDLMSRLRIHRTAPPLQWIEILCSAITKETPNAG